VRIVILLGPPGAGKGTQAVVLAEHLGLPHVATGDLFRAAVRERTALGLVAQGYMSRGELVPDGLAVQILMERLAEPDAGEGVVLDGFPRTRSQAETLDRELRTRGGEIDLAILIEVPADVLVRRMSDRWICSAEGHVFNQETNAPATPGVCDVDGSALVQREDDRPEVVRTRLERQLGALDEVVDYYRARGVLRVVDGRDDIATVSTRVLAATDALVSGSR
jgi:adenylate kinase